jgi:GNAT superfamily N-acetyltransferase
MTSIRETDIERDAEALTALAREVNPALVVTTASLAHRMRTMAATSRAQSWVAEEDGAVVGRADAFLSPFAPESGDAGVAVAVAAPHRRRGIGGALYERALAHAQELGAVRLLSHFHASDAGISFAERQGFVEVRSETESVLDPRSVTERTDADARPLTDVEPHLAYEIDMEATHDMPATEEFEGMTYEEWAEHVLDHPLFAPEGSFVVFADGDAAALSLIVADHETGRATSMFTGTRRAFRGRGLALAAKLASIEWAARNGVTSMHTYNDETNAPMLAVNRRLGYVPSGRQVEMLKEGTASSPAPPAPAT